MLRPFEEIVVEHGPAVLRVCRAMAGPERAQDAWSETFLSALRAYPSLRPDSNVRGWLVTIAHRKAIDQLRSAGRAPTPTGELVDVPVWHETPGEDGELVAAVASLPPKQRGAVVYRYLADLPYGEVARLLDCSEAAARRNAADGIARLRATYQRGADHDC